MKTNYLLLVALLSGLVAACTPSQQDVETAVASTMAPQQTIAAAVVQTQAALPSATPIPPTATLEPEATPTATEDPCAPEQARTFYNKALDILKDWGEKIQGIAVDDSGFRALTRLELTDLRTDFVELEYPECATAARLKIVAAMDEMLDLTDTLIEDGEASQETYDSAVASWEDALDELTSFYQENVD